jgi:hypothetical protein
MTTEQYENTMNAIGITPQADNEINQLKIRNTRTSIYAKPSVLISMDKFMTRVIHLHKCCTVWPFLRPDDYARETHHSRRQGPRLPTRQ